MVSAPGAARREVLAGSPARPRLEALDMLRGLAIVVVLAFHSRNYSLVLPAQPGTAESITWATLTELFLIPVPVFVILSGVVLGGRPRAGESRSGFARQRLIRLLVPLAAWSLIALLVSVTVQGHAAPSGAWDWFSTVALGTRWYPLYFLVAALQLSLLVAVLPRDRRGRDLVALALLGVQLAAVCALQVVVHLRPDDLAPVSANASYLALSWTGYFALGLLAAPRLASIAAAAAAVRLATAAAGLVSMAWVVGIARDGGALSYYQSPLHMVLAASVALLGLWTLPALPARGRRVLAGVGVVSFGVYLGHGVVLPVVAWIAGPGRQVQPATGLAWLTWLGITAATLAGTLVLQRVLRAAAPGRWLLGEPPRPRPPAPSAGAAARQDAYTAGAV